MMEEKSAPVRVVSSSVPPHLASFGSVMLATPPYGGNSGGSYITFGMRKHQGQEGSPRHSRSLSSPQSPLVAAPLQSYPFPPPASHVMPNSPPLSHTNNAPNMFQPSPFSYMQQPMHPSALITLPPSTPFYSSSPSHPPPSQMFFPPPPQPVSQLLPPAAQSLQGYLQRQHFQFIQQQTQQLQQKLGWIAPSQPPTSVNGASPILSSRQASPHHTPKQPDRRATMDSPNLVRSTSPDGQFSNHSPTLSDRQVSSPPSTGRRSSRRSMKQRKPPPGPNNNNGNGQSSLSPAKRATAPSFTIPIHPHPHRLAGVNINGNGTTESDQSNSPPLISGTPPSPTVVGADSALIAGSHTSPSLRSRKILIQNKSSTVTPVMDSKASMRSAYLNVLSPAGTRQHKSTPTSRRASVCATDSLVAGVPVNLVSSLHAVGLVSSLFSSAVNNNSGGTNGVVDPSSGIGSPASDSRYTSRRASTAAMETASPPNEPIQFPTSAGAPAARKIFPWSLANEAVWNNDVKLPKLSRATTAVLVSQSDDVKVEQSDSTAIKGVSASTAARSSLTVPGSGSSAESSRGPSPKRAVSVKMKRSASTKRDSTEGDKSEQLAQALKDAITSQQESTETQSTQKSNEKSTEASPQGSPVQSPVKRKNFRIQLRRSLTDPLTAPSLNLNSSGQASPAAGGDSSSAKSTSPATVEGANDSTAPGSEARSSNPSPSRASDTNVAALAAAVAAAAAAASANASASGAAESADGVIYITRETKAGQQKRVIIVDPAKIAREKAEKAEKERARMERAAERDRKKFEQEEERKYRLAEKEALKEQSRLARERMKSLMAEHAIARKREQDRLKQEREAEEKAEKEAAEKEEADRLAAEQAESGNASGLRAPRMTRAAQLRREKSTALSKARDMETEARRKVAQDLNPDFDGDVADHAEREEQARRNKRGSGGGLNLPPSDVSSPGLSPAPSSADLDTFKDSPAPINRRATNRMTRQSVGSAAWQSMLKGTAVGSKDRKEREKEKEKEREREIAIIESKKKRPLITARVINAAKRGDVDDIRKALIEEFGGRLGFSTKELARTNANGETRADYLNRIDKNGSSALFHGVWPGHYEFMFFCLQHGASPNLQNNRLNTVMHLAVERGHEDVIRLLLRYAADPTLVNSHHQTPFQVVPSAKEQLQWASFLFLNLESIWKKANPDWVADSEKDIVEEEEEEENDEESQENKDDTNKINGGDSKTDSVEDRAKSPVVDGSSQPSDSTSPFNSYDSLSSNTAMPNFSAPPPGDEIDFTNLAPLNPSTPQWLAELSAIFMKKHEVRAHTKVMSNKLLSVMRMGFLTKKITGATSSTSTSPLPPAHVSSPSTHAHSLGDTPSPQVDSPAIGSFASGGSSTSSPMGSARNTLSKVSSPSTTTNGLANLLKKMSVTKGTVSIDAGQPPVSQRSSLELRMASPQTSRQVTAGETSNVGPTPFRLDSASPAPSTENQSAVAPVPTPVVAQVKTFSIFSESIKDF